MKKKTHKIVKGMLQLLKRKKAYFYKDENGEMNYTYPKGGWVNDPTIDGKPLVYVGEHDEE